jgi:hypothetical protein
MLQNVLIVRRLVGFFVTSPCYPMQNRVTSFFILLLNGYISVVASLWSE